MHLMHRRRFLTLAAAPPLLGLTAGVAPAAASPAVFDESGPFPTLLALPDGFRPEGIAIGPGLFAYFGSLADGDIYRADLRSGRGRIIGQGPGTPSVGMKTDALGRLFIAGGDAGNGRIVDTHSGEILASYDFAATGSFVNDVVLTDDAAWFTDSLRPFLYRLPLRHLRLPRQSDVETIALGGDIEYVEGFNINGIAQTPDRSALLAVQSNKALLFRIDPTTGEGTQVDLGGVPMTNGDGLLVLRRTLYVVQNLLNRVAVVELNRSGSKGRVVTYLADPRFDVPTTVAAFGRRLYLPNARFTTPPEPTTTYSAVAIDQV